MLPVVCPFLTGNEPLLLTGVVTVSLFEALGCFPPPLMQAYVADASAERVIVSVLTVVPSPASLKVATRLPALLTLALALMKCGLLAKAAETERTSISIASNAAITNRRIVSLLSKYNANIVKKCAHAHYWLFQHGGTTSNEGSRSLREYG